LQFDWVRGGVKRDAPVIAGGELYGHLLLLGPVGGSADHGLLLVIFVIFVVGLLLQDHMKERASVNQG
jgi:hypothetical protein